MFYSRQFYASLVESISNFVFKEEEKIDLASKKTEVITKRCFTKQLFFLLCQKVLKIPAKKFIFLAKLRLEAYNFTKNKLLCRYFEDNFTMIILLRFKVFAFHVQSSKSTYHAGHVSVAASEQEFKQNINLFSFSVMIFLHKELTILAKIF